MPNNIEGADLRAYRIQTIYFALVNKVISLMKYSHSPAWSMAGKVKGTVSTHQGGRQETAPGPAAYSPDKIVPTVTPTWKYDANHEGSAQAQGQTSPNAIRVFLVLACTLSADSATILSRNTTSFRDRNSMQKLTRRKTDSIKPLQDQGNTVRVPRSSRGSTEATTWQAKISGLKREPIFLDRVPMTPSGPVWPSKASK